MFFYFDIELHIATRNNANFRKLALNLFVIKDVIHLDQK